MSPLIQQFLGSPDIALSQLLDRKVGELVDQDEMLNNVMKKEKREQLKVKFYIIGYFYPNSNTISTFNDIDCKNYAMTQ